MGAEGRQQHTVQVAVFMRFAGSSVAVKLCAECRELSDYVDARIEQCPVIDTKTFCSSCEVHCYSPAK